MKYVAESIADDFWHKRPIGPEQVTIRVFEFCRLMVPENVSNTCKLAVCYAQHEIDSSSLVAELHETEKVP